MNDIEHNFVDTVSTERILQWRAAIQELINVGFAMEFVLDHLHKVARAFFTRFDQSEVNDLGLVEFWGSGPPYVDFHGFQVPEDCVSHLVTIYSNRGDFSRDSALVVLPESTP